MPPCPWLMDFGTEYRGGLFDVESRVVGGEFFGSSFLIRSF